MSRHDVEEQMGGAHQGDRLVPVDTCPKHGPWYFNECSGCAIEKSLARETYGRSPVTSSADMASLVDDAIIAEFTGIHFAEESAARKAAPLWSGCMLYFPDALLAVARLSKKANEKHNPGEPLHWSKGKSNDHGDCIARHQLNPEEIDPEFNEIHAVMVAWRSLAQLQTIIEKKREATAAGEDQQT